MSTILPVNPITPGINQYFNPNVPLVARFDLSITQLTSCFSTPLGLLSGLNGYYIHVLDGMFIRSGSPFDTQAGSLTVNVNASSPFGVLTWLSANSPLTAAGSNFASFRQFSNGNSFLAGVNASNAAADFGGKGITLSSTVSNPTVTVGNPGSACILLITYKVVPNLVANVGSY